MNRSPLLLCEVGDVRHATDARRLAEALLDHPVEALCGEGCELVVPMRVLDRSAIEVDCEDCARAARR